MNEFSYHRPASIVEARALMGGTADPRLIAGGMSLLPTMKLGFSAPSDLIDLSAIAGLTGVERTPDALSIRAMTTHREVARSEIVRAALPALAELAEGIGDRQVRARGTIGGSLANNDPAACYPAATLALGATITTDRRSIAADDYFQGIYQTALEPDEIITDIRFPIPLAAR